MANDVPAANDGYGRGLSALLKGVEGPDTDTGGFAEIFYSIGKGRERQNGVIHFQLSVSVDVKKGGGLAVGRWH